MGTEKASQHSLRGFFSFAGRFYNFCALRHSQKATMGAPTMAKAKISSGGKRDNPETARFLEMSST